MSRLPFEVLWRLLVIPLALVLIAITILGRAESSQDNGIAQSKKPLVDDPKAREEWFYGQRAFPESNTPPGALQRAREQMLAHNMPSLDTIVPTWQPLGPAPITSGWGNWGSFSGRVTSIAVNPTNNNIIYAGAATGGVWKTTNGGATWVPLTDHLPSLAVGSIALDPSNPNVIYLGTGEANNSADSYYSMGIFKSTDAGVTWVKLDGTTFDYGSVSKVLVHPNNPLQIMAATSLGIYRSMDGGISWTRVLGYQASDIAVDPRAPAVWYAALGGAWYNPDNGVYKSNDSGATWTKLGGGLPTTDVGRIALAVSPSNPQRLYAAVQNSSNSSWGGLLGIWTSTNGGSSWVPTSPSSSLCGGQCWYDLVLMVDPANDQIMYAGGIGLWKTTNAGATYFEIGAGMPFWFHPDQHALVFDNAGRLLIGNDGGMYRADNGGSTFVNLNTNLAITQFYPGIAGSLDSFLIGGTQDNSTVKYRGSPGWPMFYGSGDGANNAVNPANTNVLYVGTVGLGIFKSTDGGATFSRTESGIMPSEPRGWIAPMVMDPSNPSVLYAGTNRLYRTIDGAALWSAISPPFPGTLTAIGTGKSNPSLIYIGSGSRLEVTTNGGGTWIDTTQNGLPNRYITDIAVYPTDSNEAYVTVSGFGSGHVFRTINHGGLWMDISGNLPDVPVNAIALDSRYMTSILYVGTDLGVFRSQDMGLTWVNINGSSLPNTVVTDLLLDIANNKLVAATHGRGVFASTPAVGVPRCSLTGTVRGATGGYYLENAGRLLAFLYGSVNFPAYLGQRVTVGGPCSVYQKSMGPVPIFLAQTIQLAPPPVIPSPTLVSPADNITLTNLTVTFSWQAPIPDVASYTLRVKTVADMDSGGTTVLDTSTTGTRYTFAFPSQYQNMTLYWSARTWNQSGQHSDWAAARSFRIWIGCSAYQGWFVIGSATAPLWRCEGGTVQAQSTTGDSLLVSAQVYSDVVLSAVVSTTDREASLAFRMQDAANGYIVIFIPDGVPFTHGIWVAKRVNYQEQYIAYYYGSPFPSGGQPAQLSVSAVGSIIRISLNGRQVLETNDSAFSSGRAGLRINGDQTYPCDSAFSQVTVGVRPVGIQERVRFGVLSAGIE